MTANTQTITAEELGEILDQEREALLLGDLEKLSDLLVPKETLIDAMNSIPNPDLPTMQALGKKVQRNQLLLDGALEGIRAVASRVSRLREVKGALETYGADGKRREISLGIDSAVEHRV
jgi:flagellar biosynthesis/type III secretory pathway chaperone